MWSCSNVENIWRNERNTCKNHNHSHSSFSFLKKKKIFLNCCHFFLDWRNDWYYATPSERYPAPMPSWFDDTCFPYIIPPGMLALQHKHYWWWWQLWRWPCRRIQNSFAVELYNFFSHFLVVYPIVRSATSCLHQMWTCTWFSWVEWPTRWQYWWKNQDLSNMLTGKTVILGV